MIEDDKHWLRVVKAILVFLKVISYEDKIAEKPWLDLKEHGYKPHEAISVDMDINVMPLIKWTEVLKIIDKIIADENSTHVRHPL